MTKTVDFLAGFKKSIEKTKAAHPDAVRGFGELFQRTMKDGAAPNRRSWWRSASP